MPRIGRDNQKRIYVTLRDGQTKKSRTFTIYDITPSEAARLIRDAVRQLAEKEQQTAA